MRGTKRRPPSEDAELSGNTSSSGDLDDDLQGGASNNDEDGTYRGGTADDCT
jgi:hypothetical protein